MSSIHGTLRRYQLIIEKLSRNGYASLAEIKSYLYDRGFSIANRTLQRDIEKLRFEFDVNIIYNRSRNGYYIDAASQKGADKFLRFAQTAHTTQLIAATLHDGKNKLQYFSFESRGDLKGMEHLPALLSAIESNSKVQITHTRFGQDLSKTYTVLPYLLKEYQNRWYLVGVSEEAGDFRSFGIDRIESFTVLEETFSRDAWPDPEPFFDHTIGIVYSLNEIEEVELSFDPYQGNYIKTLPLHDSQVIVEDNDQELRIRVDIRPNFEFQQIILGYGNRVKVIKPGWLVQEIKKNLKANLKQYEEWIDE